MSWIPELWRLKNVIPETQDTATLVIEPALGTIHGNPRPGQFYMLYAFGIGEIPVSISAIQDSSLSFTVRRVGAVSEALNQLLPGKTCGARGPFGRPWPEAMESSRTLLVIAGGVGLAPLKPVIEEALRNGKGWNRVLLLYGSRDVGHLLYQKEIRGWSALGLEYHVTVDTADVQWPGPVGVITQLLDRISWDPGQTLALLCGPEIMMRFCIDKLKAAGLSDERIFLSMERNMKCAVAFCGHCQYGNYFVCTDGPVFCYNKVASYLRVKEL